ncbi:response regulator [Mesorhizobium sp. M1A.F.Ca.IN.022.07.1.1]|uniref:response regulator transcription factor n=1 Tax=unclassified Mesorhizobium TaxID=325217 RepID=UPI000BAE6F60|nr:MULTISPECIES: response regulator [unclassified Mesorhizobium]TGV90104.1 response regulator [Mesorhizobium sp. M00.F.Ca.ET.158.01.1.1]AZO61771.1 response regulator [Mesorhizobium sp. M1A.F.Ca.IN.022.06.1.1]MCT2580580.1 response regulator [Mesorhizobium sp. P13.3]MDF3169522.1 response regulator [Mesorhizobium sp. P16.1]MDF3178816.1 response regulator [Mesorhizobium sp. P17.1]
MSNGAVLVVEDETMILLDLETGLEEAGFEVVGVGSASAAIAAFDEAPDAFKALVSDVRLGPGPSGWEVARHVRQVNSTIPVVYVSGDSASQWGAEGVPNSIMITKPFFMPQIITAISTLMNEQLPTDTPTQPASD